MKKLIATAAIIMTLATGVFADEKALIEQKKELMKQKCISIQELAEIIMEARQKGIAKSELIPIVMESSHAQLIVEDAYRLQIIPIPEWKQELIIEFKNKWFRICSDGSI
jgi:hypothetical protein